MSKRPRVANVRAAVSEHSMEVSLDALDSAVQGAPHCKLQVVPLDRKLYAVPSWVWRDIIDYNRVDRKTYEAEKFDCDDFAIAFKGLVARDFRIGGGVGLVVDTSGRHAYNALLVKVDRKAELRFLEPQTDRMILDPGAEDTMYDMDRGFIIF